MPRLWWLRRTLHDVRCGRHSGIPSCCMGWYVGPWRWISGTWLRRFYFDRIPESFQHIGCPRCLWRSNAATVRDCGCGTGDWLTRLILDLDPVEGEGIADGRE
jgi:hypothetical protein